MEVAMEVAKLNAARHDINVYVMRSNLMDWLSELTEDMSFQEARAALGASDLEVGSLRGGKLSMLSARRLKVMWNNVQRE